MYIDFIIKVFLGYISCACIIDVRFLQRFWQNMSILRGPNLRNQVAFFAQAPRKLRASKKMHPVGSEERGPHVPPAYYSHQNSRQRRLAKYCQRDLSTQRRRKGRQRTAVKERQRKARSDVMSCSSSATSSSDSSDWKKSAQVHCCREIEALVFLLAGLMIVRQGMFFNWEKRRHASKCVIRPILGTNFSNNRHIYIYCTLTFVYWIIMGVINGYHDYIYIWLSSILVVQ